MVDGPGLTAIFNLLDLHTSIVEQYFKPATSITMSSSMGSSTYDPLIGIHVSSAKVKGRHAQKESSWPEACGGDEITVDGSKNVSKTVSHRDSCTEKQKQMQIYYD